MVNPLDFLKDAVQDGQETIRALDVKLAAVLVAIMVPIPLLGSISGCLKAVYLQYPTYPLATLLFIFAFAWIGAILSFSLAIGAIGNPAIHVRGAGSLKGVLFLPGQYSFSAVDAFLNRSDVVARQTPQEHLDDVPTTDSSAALELSFEHLKIAYIRDLKMFRMRWGFRFSGVALLVGGAFYLLGTIYTSSCGV